MHAITRGKSRHWQLSALTLSFSFVLAIIFQSVAAQPTSWANNGSDPFAKFESTYLATSGIFFKETVKPRIYETHQDHHVVVFDSVRANEQSAFMEINQGTISWILSDSKGRQYHLEVTLDEYESMNTLDRPVTTENLETEGGQMIPVRDYTKFVQAGAFSELADELYENAGSDYQFIYETWYVATHATSYAKEDVEQVSYPLETLYVAKGDCEDLTILIASLLTASSHTKDWDIKLVYFDAFNPGTSNTVNHVALYVDTGKESTFVESTTDSNGLTVWDKVNGWYLNV